MKKVITILVCSVLFHSCKKEVKTIVNTPPPVPNASPVTDAGPDQIIKLPLDSVLVDGSGSADATGTIVSYAWTKILGPGTFNIVKPSSEKTIINKLVTGIYQFQLTVTDNGGLSAKDTMLVIVSPVSTGNSSVFFWTPDLVYNYIYITINNETKLLDESSVSDPYCKPYGGCIGFDLPAGQYTYKTWRTGRDTITATCTVYPGICNSVRITY
ncbi:MAG TPA: PKD domain-containing protein [Chitinophagaceae bacterium]|nr:PKD domain-containing protein [Chitinophagaceae bacterium]